MARGSGEHRDQVRALRDRFAACSATIIGAGVTAASDRCRGGYKARG